MRDTDLPHTELESMNRDHRDQVEMVNAVLRAIDEDDGSEAARKHLAETLDDFAEHTREHFRQEDDQMLRYHFPAFDQHREAHALALGRMDEVIEAWRTNRDHAALRQYFREDFPRWLVHHVTTMDVFCAQYVAGEAH